MGPSTESGADQEQAVVEEQGAPRGTAVIPGTAHIAHVELVRAVALAANTSWSPAQAFDVAVEVVARYASWPVGVVWELEDRAGGATLVPSAMFAPAAEVEPAVRELLRPLPISGAGVLGALVSTGTPASVWRLGADPAAVSQAAIEAGFSHAAAFAVIARGEAAAVLQFLLRVPLAHDPSLLAAMETVCLQLSRVVERAATEAELAEREAQVRELLDVTGGMLLTIAPDTTIEACAVNESTGPWEPQRLLQRRLDALLDTDPARLAASRAGAGAGAAPLRTRLTLDGADGADGASVEIRTWPSATADRTSVLVIPVDRSPATSAPRTASVGPEIVGAVERGELVVYYQPLIELATGRLCSLEALVRWQHPTRGLLAPGAFIAEAESTGEIHAVGRAVLGAACHHAAAWRDRSTSNELRIAVNLSARELDDPGLVGAIADVLATTELDPSALTLEVTESAIAVDTPGALRRLWQLRELGVALAIDDFGTGYSSLARLRAFPFDVLKIDRSFIQHVTSTGDDLRLLQAGVELAEAFELRVVAEGIENPAQLHAALRHGCTEVQGFLFCRPLPAAAIARLLDDPTWDTNR